MLKLQGKYNESKVFTNNVDETATGQIIDLCNQEFVKDSQIRIMQIHMREQVVRLEQQ
ncbi:hypothetical protein P9155_33110 [Bacillus cereus]|nr:hypothetical protein [Bacillus cereus]